MCNCIEDHTCPTNTEVPKDIGKEDSEMEVEVENGNEKRVEPTIELEELQRELTELTDYVNKLETSYNQSLLYIAGLEEVIGNVMIFFPLDSSALVARVLAIRWFRRSDRH